MNKSMDSSAGSVTQTKEARDSLNKIAQALASITDMNSVIASAADTFMKLSPIIYA